MIPPNNNKKNPYTHWKWNTYSYKTQIYKLSYNKLALVNKEPIMFLIDDYRCDKWQL